MNKTKINHKYTIILNHTYNLKTKSKNLLIIKITNILLNKKF